MSLDGRPEAGQPAGAQQQAGSRDLCLGLAAALVPAARNRPSGGHCRVRGSLVKVRPSGAVAVKMPVTVSRSRVQPCGPGRGGGGLRGGGTHRSGGGRRPAWPTPPSLGRSRWGSCRGRTRPASPCMCTDPGDLVLDPTCGSGTTAYVAEQWGRRWITTDTCWPTRTRARPRRPTSPEDVPLNVFHPPAVTSARGSSTSGCPTSP